jgi:hypothetical protein
MDDKELNADTHADDFLERAKLIGYSLLAAFLVWCVFTVGEKPLKLGYVAGEAVFFWLKCGFVYFAFSFARSVVTRDASKYRQTDKVSTTKKLLSCVQCVCIVAFIACLVAANHDSDVDENWITGFDSNCSAIVFVTILVPAMLGLFSGFDAPPEHSQEGNSSDM